MNNILMLHKKALLGLFVLIQYSVGYAQLEITTTPVTCYGGEDGSITVKTGFQAVYEWLDGYESVGPSCYRSNLKAGAYTVTIWLRDGGTGKVENCFEARSIEVEQPEKPLAINIKTLPNPGPHGCGRTVPVTLQVTPTGGTPPYLINGQPRDIYLLPVNSSGVYKFNVYDSENCSKRRERHVLIGRKWCANDPNDIVGPSGYDEPMWVSKFDTLPYTIRFENDPLLATAPAQHVFVTHDFDEEINPYSFRLSDFGFGDYHFSIPGNVPFFQNRYDLTEELDIYLDVIAGLNVETNQAFWSLTAIDPLTGQRPVDPLVGFLPINDTLTSSGEGFVSFTVKPKANTMTGDTAHAQAEIVFDENDPIKTNIWTNVIDALPPTTTLDALELEAEVNLIPLSWTGSDDPNGSGLGQVRLFVSVDSGAFEWIDVIHPDSTVYIYRGEYGRHYQFRLIGIDNTGNREHKTDADGAVFILPRTEILFENLGDIDYCAQDTLIIDWSSVMVDTVDLYMQIIPNGPLVAIASGLAADASPFVWAIADSLSDMNIRLHILMTDSTEIRDSSGVTFIRRLPDVNAGDDIETCIGTIHHLFGTGAYQYLWQPQSIYSVPGEPVLSFIADTTTLYHLTGVDATGCSNTDSILVTVHPTTLDTVLHEMCNQDSIFAGGNYQTEPGFYTDELSSLFGCDSTVVTEIVLTGPCTFPSPQVYVDKDATGLNNGTSWTNAFVELRDALEASREWANAEEIWIAEGIYSPHPTIRDSSFVLRDSVKIYGGFIGVELTRAERTNNPALVQISGDINLIDTLSDNSYHTLVLSQQCDSCVVDGVTITYGHANASGPDNIGAGVLNQGIGHFRNVVFERNYATDQGGALHSSGAGANLIIENCIFRLNISSLGKDVVNLSGAQIEFRGANSIH